MTALATVVAELACCLGFGALMLRLLGLRDEPAGLRVGIAFALGFGLLGWLLFFVGIGGMFTVPVFLAVLAVGLAGLPLLAPTLTALRPPKLDPLGWTLVALLAVVFALDLVEAMAPPTDADSLAYHFAAPRQFVRAGAIEFILRPLDGAIPYLVQMTYVPALALGGERAMTLWTMATGWAAVGLCLALAREHLPRNWALAVALLLATVPATIYAAGTGQIEIRMALFGMASAWGAGRAIATGRLRFAALAGLAGGFYIAAKYLGLLFAAAVGAVLLAHRRAMALILTFGIVAVVAGVQWYGWNALHTGDPAFPMFFQWLGRTDLALWTHEHDAFFKGVFMELDRPIPRTLVNMLLYPFWVTLDAPPATEGKQVGLGPFGLLILPVALWSVWHWRHAIRRGPLLAYAAVTTLFFVLWFVTGSSQRVRHLLPLAPLLFICLAVAAERATRARPALRAPVAVALALSLVVQLGGTALFGWKYVRHLASGEDHETYLRGNLAVYEPVPWLNAHLGAGDRLFIGERQLFYFLDMPTLFASPHTQAAVDLRADQADAAQLYHQLRAAGLTHVLLRRVATDQAAYGQPAMDALSHSPCLQLVRGFDARAIGSRTLPGSGAPVRLDLYRVAGACALP